MEDLSKLGSIMAGGRVWINPQVIRDILDFPLIEEVRSSVLKKALIQTLDEIERQSEISVIRESYDGG